MGKSLDDVPGCYSKAIEDAASVVATIAVQGQLVGAQWEVGGRQLNGMSTEAAELDLKERILKAAQERGMHVAKPSWSVHWTLRVEAVGFPIPDDLLMDEEQFRSACDTARPLR